MTTTEIQRVAMAMVDSGLPFEFGLQVVAVARETDAILELASMWEAETDAAERDETIVALQRLLDDYEQPVRAGQGLADEAEADVWADQIAKWKLRLRGRVDAAGGVSAVARLANMPQPSLSRILHDFSVPRHATLVKLAQVLGVTVHALRPPRSKRDRAHRPPSELSDYQSDLPAADVRVGRA